MFLKRIGKECVLRSFNRRILYSVFNVEYRLETYRSPLD